MFQFIKSCSVEKEPEHLRRGRLGEEAAKRHLKSVGLKFLVANYKTKDSEIDLFFGMTTPYFVEVKARTEGLDAPRCCGGSAQGVIAEQGRP